MARYGKKASDKVEKVMHERKKGTLKSGSGKKVTSRIHAIAIGLLANTFAALLCAPVLAAPSCTRKRFSPVAPLCF